MKRGLFILVGLAACGPTTAESSCSVSVVVSSGPFRGVHGLAVGAEGELYAGDILGMTVHQVDPETGAHRPVVGPPVGMADDVAVAREGTSHAGLLAWTGVFTGKLYTRSADGIVRQVADGWVGINGIGFSPAGDLYATQAGPAGAALWHVDLSGRGRHVKVPADVGALNGFVIADDGYLYGPRGDQGVIVRLDLQTLDSTVVAEGFEWPTAVKMDSDKNLYVVDYGAGSVTRIDRGDWSKRELATLEPGLDNLVIDDQDRLFVSSITRNGIFEIDRNTGAVRAVVQGKLTAPGGVAILDEGRTRAFIADMFVLREVDLRTGEVFNLTVPSRDGPYPSSVSAHMDRGAARVVYTSWFEGTLSVIDPDARVVLREVRGLRAPGDALGLANGTLVVAETGAGQVTGISADGTRRRVGPALRAPVGLALDTRGELLVTDFLSGELVSINMESGDSSTIATDLGSPEGVAVLPDGQVVVADSSQDRLLVVDPVEGTKRLITRSIPFGIAGPDRMRAAWIHNGVAVSKDGTIYVSSDKRSALYRVATLSRSGSTACDFR